MSNRINAWNIVESFLSNLPEQFKGKANIEGLIGALAAELQEVSEVFRQLNSMRSMETAQGKQLDGIGDIVVLSRSESAGYAGIIDFDVIDDERYRLFLKYKALRNSNTCTFPELMEVCRLLYDAKLLYYTEFEEHPAHFKLMVGAQFNETMLNMLNNTKLTIKPGGVSVDAKFFDLDFFGFGDLNKEVLGFGIGKFIHIIGEE